MKEYLKILKFLKGHEKIFGLSIVVMFVASFFEGAQLTLLVPISDRIFNNKQIVIPNNLPDFLERIVNKINAVDSNTLFWLMPFVVLGLLLTKHALTFMYQYMMSDLSERITKDTRYKVYKKIQNLSLSYFSKKRTGELSSRISHDVQLLDHIVSYALVDLFRQTFLVIMYIGMAFMIYPRAALGVFFVFPLLAIPISSLGTRLRKLSKSTQEKFADITSHLIETISGAKLVKAFAMEDYEVERFAKENQGFYKLKIKTIKRMLAISPITEIFGAVCGVTVLLMIGRSVMEGSLSFGAFILFFGSIMSVISPIKKLGNTHILIQKGLAAGERIYEILDEEITVKEKEGAINIPVMSESIVLKGVEFHYDHETTIVLKGVDLQIRKGELVAIVGPTGTGKTTLVNLLPRFYDPSAGQIFMDGIDIKDASFASLRKQFGIVTQESILFHDTVRSNIAYGNFQASQQEVEEAAKKAFAHRFVSEMPQGYETVIGDQGFRLSGGEKQRISIARAILKNPPILILDEATSQLDSESEKFVQEALDKLMQGRTVVAIAHRLSTVKKADKIVVLENGKIAGIGKHDELLTTCPLYAKLHSMQFQA